MAKPKILIIEDEPSLLGLFAEYLRKDYDVLPANSGAEGISIFDANYVSLILLDLKLRDMSGLDVLRRIRGKSPTLPVIAMTGYSSHETAVKCADLGVQGYIQKPMRLEELKRRIDNCLGMEQKGLFKDTRDTSFDERLRSASHVVKIALRIIHQRFRDPALSRHLIAEAVGICDDYLSKQFHKDCGLSIPEYINKLRIAEAARQLAVTNAKVSEIALSLGFSNGSYFSSIFKKSSGMTPEHYRREKRLAHLIHFL